jgi:uncharacterized membrane protein (DUF106 family)
VIRDVDLGLPAFAGIAPASAAAALLALYVLRRWSDQKKIKEVRSRMAAHLLEFRLFIDEPALILWSQRDLFVDNARMLRLLARPLLILVVPMALIVWQLEALYARAPLRLGEAAVVTTESRQNSITVPDGVAVETEPVYLQATNETCWRIRPSRTVSGMLRTGPRQSRLVAGSGVTYLLNPNGVTYPHAKIFGLHWLIWFLILSTIGAFILRKPMRVVL